VVEGAGARGGLTSRVVTAEALSPDTLASIEASTRVAVIGQSSSGVISSWNAGAERLYGYPAGDAIGCHGSTLVPPDRRPAEAMVVDRVLLGEAVEPYATQRLGKDERRIQVSVNVVPIRDVRGRIVGVAAVEHEVAASDQRALAHEAEARLRSAFDDAPIGMALVSIEPGSVGRFLHANGALSEILGRSPGELEALDIEAVTHVDDFKAERTLLERLLAGEIPSYQVEKRCIPLDRQLQWVLVSASLVRDAAGDALSCIQQVQDLEERKQFERRLEYFADHDPLTGLFNRRRFRRELSHQIALERRYGGSGAVLLFDIDNFKYVNDTLGHSAGDEAIAAIGHLVRERLRESDTLARLGGDEFAVLMPQADEAQAAALAEDLLEAVAKGADIDAGPRQVSLTLSIGVALFDGQGSRLTEDDILVEADLAMYDAKDAGRNRTAFAAHAQQNRLQERLSWSDRVRAALEDDKFVLYSQPILDLKTDEIRQHELLLRLPDEHGKLVLPATFLYTAERFGLVHAIDRWVIGHAIELLAAEHGAGHDLRLEVNVSGASMSDPELPEFVQERLRATAVDPTKLIIEITETAAIANMEHARNFVAKLTALGCPFAIDDFGAGFGSFYYLKHLAADYLKIDGEFIHKLPASSTDQMIVRSVVQMANGLGKQTIAEFVGDAETIRLLRTLGVDYAQGYYIGRPRALSELHSPL
jgi:diguanylate cyclase (GGDEF)-like protein/PAS domain S-box-containing protein